MVSGAETVFCCLISSADGLESRPFFEGGFKSREVRGEDDRLFRALVLLVDTGVDGAAGGAEKLDADTVEVSLEDADEDLLVTPVSDLLIADSAACSFPAAWTESSLL